MKATLDTKQLGAEPKEPVWFERQGLESDRIHLIYLSRVYKTLMPNLKGIHLTIDGFRPHRDEDGLRITNSDDLMKLGLADQEEINIPKEVAAVPRMRADVEASWELMQPEVPLLIPIQPSQMARVCICFGTPRGRDSTSLLGCKAYQRLSTSWDYG
jgi:hypothetical protein